MLGFETFIWGLLGGIGAELVVYFGMRHELASELPFWMKSVSYWVVVVAMVLFGGIITLAYFRSGTPLNAILALQVGASAPLFLRKIRDIVPETPENIDPTKVN